MSFRQLFGTWGTRLGRTNWGTKVEGPDGKSVDTGVQPLAEELIALASSEEPIELVQPIQFVRNFDGPVFEVIDASEAPEVTAPLATARTVDQEPEEAEPLTEGSGNQSSEPEQSEPEPGSWFGTILETNSGTNAYRILRSDGEEVTAFPAMNVQENERLPAGLRVLVAKTQSEFGHVFFSQRVNPIPGVVVSGGPGVGPYEVALYRNGPTSGATDTVSVAQLQIHEEDAIPSSTAVMVTSHLDQFYTMQVPVWL